MKKSFQSGIKCLGIAALTGIICCLGACQKNDNENQQITETESYETQQILTEKEMEITTEEDISSDVLDKFELEMTRPLGNELSVSGSVYPEGKSNISIHLDFSAVQKYDSEYADLTVKVMLDCYSISVGERNKCVLNIGGTDHTFIAPEIRSDENVSSSFELYQTTVQIYNPYNPDPNSVVITDISACYNFGGTYSDAQIGNLCVSGSVALSQSSDYVNPIAPELPSDPYTPDL